MEEHMIGTGLVEQMNADAWAEGPPRIVARVALYQLARNSQPPSNHRNVSNVPEDTEVPVNAPPATSVEAEKNTFPLPMYIVGDSSA